MRTHDDLGHSSHNVLYGEADGDVEAALGTGTSLAPQQHDETGVSESSHFLGKRRRLEIIAESARRLLGKFDGGKSAGAKQHLERMMSGLLGEKNQSSSIRSSDVSEIMQILEKMESPYEDEQWRELCEKVEFTDDVNGGNALDKDKVIAARRLEMQFFKKMGVFEKVDGKEVRSSGGKIITTKWVDTDKGHGGYHSARNKFERFRGFFGINWQIRIRFSSPRKFFVLNDSNFWCVQSSITHNVAVHVHVL